MVTLIKEIVMAESTKERILRMALELFAQNGYLGTSMNDIAGQLGFTNQNRNRTSDTRIFSPLLYQLSYLGVMVI